MSLGKTEPGRVAPDRADTARLCNEMHQLTGPAQTADRSVADLNHLLEDSLGERQERGQLRSRRPVRVLDATHLEVGGQRCVNFASNNYLGLTHHPRLISMAQSLAGGVGSGAAGLISGYTDVHASAEARLAQWKSTEAAVLLPSGYQANFAAIQTFAALADGRQGVRFLVDKLAHASLIDAVRAAGLPFRIFPHNHLGKLKRLLEESEQSQLQVVVTESIFSMDGDAADLSGIASLKASHPFALLLDEAHASGVYGSGGAGLSDELHLPGVADVVVCTLSKAAGAIGGAVCASRLFCEGLVNFGRAYIYSTAVPPGVARIAEIAVDIMRDEPWRQERVRSLALMVRARLNARGVQVPDGDSPIVPVILGNDQQATHTAQKLLTLGIFVTPIRPPTVAPGTSRLRFTLSCDHTDAEVQHLLASVISVLQAGR